MITIHSKKGKVSIPESWNELSSKEYLKVILLIHQFPLKDTTSLSMMEFRFRLLEVLTGYKRSRKKYTRADQEDINSLLSILAEKLRFVYRPEWTDREIFSILSDELALELETSFPYDLAATHLSDEIDRYMEFLKYTPVVSYSMKSNPLPKLVYKKGWMGIRTVVFDGPVFNVGELGEATTNITAGEYVDAQEYYSLFNATKKVEYLRRLTAVFYRDYRGAYNTQKSTKTDLSAHDDFCLGFYHFFQNIQEYFYNHPVYGLLYKSTNSKKSEKINLGQAESLYNASVKGYGSVNEMKNMELTDYMNLLVKDIKDAIHTLRSYEKKDFQIAKDLQLPIEVIKQL